MIALKLGGLGCAQNKDSNVFKYNATTCKRKKDILCAQSSMSQGKADGGLETHRVYIMRNLTNHCLPVGPLARQQLVDGSKIPFPKNDLQTHL